MVGGFGGRPRHSGWGDGFIMEKDKKTGKPQALCLTCLKQLKNTASARLLSHRKKCKYSSNNDMQSGCKESPSTSTESTQAQLKRKANAINIDIDLEVDDLPVPLLDSQAENPKNKFSELTNTFISSNISDLKSKRTEKEPKSKNNVNDSISQLTSNHIHKESTPSIANCVTDCSGKLQVLGPSSKIMNTFVDKLSSAEEKNINSALANLFYGCNIPLSIVESTHFKAFIKVIRPAYKPPSRKYISNTLLDETYEALKNSIHLKPSSVLLIDGWKNECANTKNVAAMLHTSEGTPAFLDAWNLSGEKETGDKLAEIVTQSVHLAKNMYNTDVYAVVSDNAANMRKMGRIVDIWHLTCNSHSGQLLAKDLIPIHVASRVNIVLKEFNKVDVEHKLLQHGGSRISLACETRWCSHRDTFKNFLFNLPAMKKLIATEDSSNSEIIPEDVTRLLYDQNFIKNVEDSIRMFDPVCELINICQSSTAGIADAAEQWIKLEFPEGFEERTKNQLTRRRKYALNEYNLTANFLHPKYKGRLLTAKHLDEVDQFLIQELTASGLNSLQQYKDSEDVFSILQEKNVTSPSTFWGMAKRKHTELSTLAMKLINVPASSAQLERVFSNWSYVHNPIRNRLTFDRSKKLLFNYHSLKIKESVATPSDEY